MYTFLPALFLLPPRLCVSTVKFLFNSRDQNINVSLRHEQIKRDIIPVLVKLGIS